MIKYSINFSLLIVFLLTSQLSISQSLISVNDLVTKKKDNNLVIIDAQKPDGYSSVHIIGAINIYHNDLYKTSGPEGILKSSSELATILGGKGVSNTNTIVIYDDGSGKYSGRLYWIFKYLGCANVMILDGQLKAWKSARKPITKAATTAKKTTFTAKVNSALLATMKDVQAGNATIIDARSAAEYNGTAESKLAKKGHIPGAINIEFSNVLDSESKLKSKADLTALFTKAGVSKSKAVILYCETSVRAGILFLALEEAGYSNVKVYDGAFNEWIANSANKVD